MGEPLSGTGLYDGRSGSKWKTILVVQNNVPVNRCIVMIRKPRMTVTLPRNVTAKAGGRGSSSSST
jgi:hypothetical protein